MDVAVGKLQMGWEMRAATDDADESSEEGTALVRKGGRFLFRCLLLFPHKPKTTTGQSHTSEKEKRGGLLIRISAENATRPVGITRDTHSTNVLFAESKSLRVWTPKIMRFRPLPSFQSPLLELWWIFDWLGATTDTEWTWVKGSSFTQSEERD